MSESFADLFEESLKKTEMKPGALVTGVIVSIDNDFVVVNAGLKSEGVIPLQQFASDGDINIGDEVEVSLDTIEDGYGETRLSREKAKRAAAWIRLDKAFDADETVTGTIIDKNKGGFTVQLGEISAFLPGSLVDVRPIRDASYLEGKELDFKVIKLDQKRNNIVVSRRAVLEIANSAEREKLLENLEEGQTVKGIVKNLTDYGAFIDLGGVDGLLHITDMSWKRVKHPSEIIAVGDEIDVKVLKYDRERTRVSLGLKQTGEDPWAKIKERYAEGTRLNGKVTNLADYGCFVEIEEGIEGLVHVSEMDWTNKNIHPSKVCNVGDEVEVMVQDIDPERRRISLSMKQCSQSPWEVFSATHTKGDKVTGKIKSITDFGLFIGLEGGIDGLIHLSDLSWNSTGEDEITGFNKGDELEAVVLEIDSERGRISLGIKQLDQDPFSTYVAANPKGSVVTGTVKEVDARGAVIELAENVEANLRVSEISQERIEDASTVLKVGDEVEAKFIGVDRKTRSINLSIKAKDVAEEAEVMSGYTDAGSATTSLGDLLKDQLNKK
ncbi:MAG: 30S ribosomal protein S1 [Gammaproteobacteria bacterium]|nr:30S ribosomal protein S1 [Gammaproteobacteria bacterium]